MAEDPNRNAPHMAAVEVWIKKHNKNPTGAKLRDADSLKEIKSLKVNQEKKKSLSRPKKNFIERSKYIAKYGDPDEKDCDEVELSDGEIIQGVYVLAPGEEEGVFHCEESYNRSTQKSTLVDDGTVIVEDGQIDKKEATLRKGMKRIAPKRTILQIMDELQKNNPDSDGDGEEGESNKSDSGSTVSGQKHLQ